MKMHSVLPLELSIQRPTNGSEYSPIYQLDYPFPLHLKDIIWSIIGYVYYPLPLSTRVIREVMNKIYYMYLLYMNPLGCK